MAIDCGKMMSSGMSKDKTHSMKSKDKKKKSKVDLASIFSKMRKK